MKKSITGLGPHVKHTLYNATRGQQMKKMPKIVHALSEKRKAETEAIREQFLGMTMQV